MAHQTHVSALSLGLAGLTVLAIAWAVVNGDGVGPQWWPQDAALLAQAGVVQIILARARLRVSADRGGGPAG